MAIQTIIVDDEDLARSRISTLLKAEPDIKVVAECNNGRAAVESIFAQKPDLLFLDVQMPELDGFEVLKAIEEAHQPVIIFVTAYDRYAIRAFEAYALDYLLKPFNRARFQKALQRARLQIARETRDRVDGRLASLLKEMRAESKYLERLIVRSAGRVIFLRTEDVERFEGCANYVRIHVGKESHLMREKISSLEERLDPKRFIRIHRSNIIRIDRIKELRSLPDGEHVVVLLDGTHLSLSRGYREHFQRILREAC